MNSNALTNKRDLNAIFIGGVLIFSVGIYYFWHSYFQLTNNNRDDTVPSSAAILRNIPTMTSEVLRQKLNNKERIRLIDIRSSHEFQSEHLFSSFSVPIGSLNGYIPEQDESVVIIYSVRDAQTLEAAKNILSQKLFPYFFLAGGFEAWKTANYQTISLGNPTLFIDQSKVTYLSAGDLLKILADKSSVLVLLDVQPPESFSVKHIKGAINIPLAEIEKRYGEIPIARTIIVYGENELVSFQAATRLFDLNIFTAKVLTGNNNLTSTSGLPIEK